MKYRLTCLTPVLVGDGQKLAPIDYMVWKDQVNVLDQRRIFRLLAKGPRLEGYLTQLKRADKLDFATWGGFAQNFAGRRIPFEHPALAGYWDRARGDSLFIPTFAAGAAGPFVPGSVLKGALRTGFVSSRWTEATLRDVASRFQGDRVPRRPGETVEDGTVGSPGTSPTRFIQVSDSAHVPVASMKVYLLRTATLRAGTGGKLELGWKQSPRGSVDGRRPEEGTPAFAEMASPGTTFEGEWRELHALTRPELARPLNWREAPSREGFFAASNRYAAELLRNHRDYAARAGLSQLTTTLEALEGQLAEVSNDNRGCLLALGWASGLLAKVAFLDTENESYRQILRQVPLFARALQSGLPFPKTRRIVFLNNQPSTLPGWTRLEVLD
jgi:CRISPR-associated protein Csm5